MSSSLYPTQPLRPYALSSLLVVGLAALCACSSPEEVAKKQSLKYNKLPKDRDLNKVGPPLDGLNLHPDRTKLDSKLWNNTASESLWTVQNSVIQSPGSHNQPLWFMKKLPKKFRIELEASCQGDPCELRFELLGDGEHHESGYVVAFGAWNNTASFIARLDEHSHTPTTRVVSYEHGDVEPGRVYSMTFLKTDRAVRWFIDDTFVLQLIDPEPLDPPNHAYFALNSWESAVSIQNIRIFNLE